MHRTLWAALAALGFAITSGCAMCESCFDYTYPAAGGVGCWTADDCCRAGSAFCYSHEGYGYAEPHGPAVIEEIHDPVPDAPGYVPEPTPAQQQPLLPPSTDDLPPTDLAPPTQLPEPVLPLDDLPDTGAPGFDDLDLQPLQDLRN